MSTVLRGIAPRRRLFFCTLTLHAHRHNGKIPEAPANTPQRAQKCPTSDGCELPCRSNFQNRRASCPIFAQPTALKPVSIHRGTQTSSKLSLYLSSRHEETHHNQCAPLAPTANPLVTPAIESERQPPHRSLPLPYDTNSTKPKHISCYIFEASRNISHDSCGKSPRHKKISRKTVTFKRRNAIPATLLQRAATRFVLLMANDFFEPDIEIRISTTFNSQ